MHLQWFCYLSVLCSWCIKIPKDAKYFKARVPYNATIDQSELNMCILFVNFLWQLLWLLFNDAYFF